MRIDGQVGGALGVAGGLDIAHGAVAGHARNPRRDIGPGAAAVAAQVHEAVVGPGPEEAFPERRLVEGVDHVGVFDADVVARQAAGELLLADVVQAEIGAYDLPALASIPGAMHELARDVHGVVVVR